MTIRDKMIDLLTTHGLWPSEVFEVLNSEELENEPMQGRWGNQTTDYPEALVSILWLTIAKRAAEYLFAKKPDHVALHFLAKYSPTIKDAMQEKELIEDSK
jgi:hypothetical protein